LANWVLKQGEYELHLEEMAFAKVEN